MQGIWKLRAVSFSIHVGPYGECLSPKGERTCAGPSNIFLYFSYRNPYQYYDDELGTLSLIGYYQGVHKNPEGTEGASKPNPFLVSSSKPNNGI